MTEPETKVRKIDMGGDLDLIVGAEPSQVQLKVSKAHLCFNSKYFKTLLGPQFIEGAAAEGGKPIPLEDDDPDAFALLMEIIHVRWDFSKALPASKVLALAIVADKYGFQDAIKLIGKAIFPANGETIEPRDVYKQYTMAEVYDLVSAAYVLDSPELFEKMTQALLEQYPPSACNPTSLTTLSDFVPSTLWLLVENRRSRILQLFTKYMAVISDRPCPNTMKGLCPQSANYFNKVCDLIESLGLHDLLIGESIADMLKKAEAMEEMRPNPPSTLFPCRIPHQEHKFTSKKYFQRIVGDIKSLCRPICLDCIKKGEFYPGRCQGCRVSR